MNESSTQTQHELTLERVLDAPQELVYRMWTEPEHLQRWCCPLDFTLLHSEGDIRVGGRFRSGMRSPDGQEHWVGGTYRELRPHRRIVFSHAWEHDDGSPQHETLVTITLEAAGNQTRLTLHQAFFLTASSRDGHRTGWNETIDSLERYLAS